MLKLLLLASTLTALTPEEHAAVAAADINQQYSAAKAAAEINKKVWILSTPQVAVKGFKSPKGEPLVDQIVTTLRQPNGHTHTCANHHTWDHKENDGHICTAPVIRNGKIEQCGLVSTIQDSPKKMVTMVRVVKSTEKNAPSAVVATKEITRQQATPVNFVEQYITRSSGGCANGQCSTITRWR